jgi:hypothetical protein
LQLLVVHEAVEGTAWTGSSSAAQMDVQLHDAVVVVATDVVMVVNEREKILKRNLVSSL